MDSGMNNETLVMTATFRPAMDTPGLLVCGEQERMLQYLCALVSWARADRVRRIVFCENGATKFDFSRVVQYLEAAGKDVEILVFDGNKDVGRFGKGYGEGEILEHVCTHSRLLQASPSFYKVTGRLFVSNFDALSLATLTVDAFQRKQPKDERPRPRKVVTTFFKCSVALFESRLVHAYKEVDDRQGVFIEHVYYNQLRDIDLPNFSIKPTLVGQQASTGRVYAEYEEHVIATAQALMNGTAIRT